MNQIWLLQGGESQLKGHADPLTGGAGPPDWQYHPNCPPWGVVAPPGKIRREEEMDAEDPEQPKQSWEWKMELEESGSLTSDYTTKLQ